MLMQKRPLRAVAGALGTLACVVVVLIYQHAPMSSYRKIIDTPSNSEAYPPASATSSTGDKSMDKPLEESWVRPASLASAWPEDLATNWHASAEQLLELDGIIDRAARCADPPCYGSDDATDWAGRRDQVVEAARTVWGAYKRHGFGRDEYFPISGESGNFTRWGIGYFIADVLDTLLLMGLNDEYQEGRDFLVSQVTFDQNGAVSLFETTIRLLGGLLSAFHWTGETDTPLLELADALGGRLAKSFNTSSGIPPETAMLRSDGQPQAMDSTTAEVTTLQMEFRYLAKLTGKTVEYQKPVDRIMEAIFKMPKYDGLVTRRVNGRTEQLTGGEISLGSRGDSYYEYLLKQWLQTRQTEPQFRAEYDAAMEGIKKHLVVTSPHQKLTYIGEILAAHTQRPAFSPKMDHLVCFLGGNLALGATNGTALYDLAPDQLTMRDREDLVLARELTETCARMYFDTRTGLSPEIAYFRWVDPATSAEIPFNRADQLQHPDGDILVHSGDRHSLLRPETVESLYLLWKITGEAKWREYGWRIFQAFQKWAYWPAVGYTSLADVTSTPPLPRKNTLESFFLAETLKYLYLMFHPTDPVSLAHHVFTTEAHPLPKFTW